MSSVPEAAPAPAPSLPGAAPAPVQVLGAAPAAAAPAAPPVPALRRNIDLLLAFFGTVTSILAWAAAGASWVWTPEATYFLTYACSGNSCTSYVSLPPSANLANLQGACAVLIFSGVATLGIAAAAALRLVAPAAVDSALARLGAGGGALTAAMGAASLAAFVFAMIGTTLPSVALYYQSRSLNGPGVGLGITNVIIVAGLVLLLAVQACASRVPAAATAAAAIAAVDFKLPAVNFGAPQAAAPVQGGIVYAAAPGAQAVPAPAGVAAAPPVVV